jgi:hypothetical protein
MKTRLKNAIFGLAAGIALLAGSFAARAAAPIGRYTIGSEIVTDNSTHLTWQRNLSRSTYSWAAAGTYCQGVSAGGLSTGWRLPTEKELESIIDATVFAPALDSVAFPNVAATGASSTFWSSTPYAGNPGNYWNVGFFYGVAGSSSPATAFSVRCVH